MATATATATTTATTETPTTTTATDGLGGVTGAGGAVALVLFILALAAVGLYVTARRYRHGANQQQPKGPPSGKPEPGTSSSRGAHDPPYSLETFSPASHAPQAEGVTMARTTTTITAAAAAAKPTPSLEEEDDAIITPTIPPPAVATLPFPFPAALPGAKPAVTATGTPTGADATPAAATSGASFDFEDPAVRRREEARRLQREWQSQITEFYRQCGVKIRERERLARSPRGLASS